MGRKNKDKDKELTDHSKCQEEIRKLKIIALLSGIPYKDDKERYEAIESFTKANLSAEEVEVLVRTLRPEYQKFKHNYLNRQITRSGIY
jgi:hypothetical protein